MTAPLPRAQATVVPILGMHRSGTSMFTRALQLLGLSLGEPLMAPQPDNPKGFWENEFFYQVDVRILQAMGAHPSGYGTADVLRRIPDLSQQVERTEETLGVIETYVTEQFRSQPLWGWKDPRTVLLFPFWLHSLVELGYRRIRPVVISRHPSHVVHSLVRRTDLGPLARSVNSSPEQIALDMWTAYSHVLLDISSETECFISLQEWYLDESTAQDELVRCSRYLDLVPPPGALAEALAWLDPGAVHHREPRPLEGLSGVDEALILHEDLSARAAAQRAQARLSDAA